MNAIKAFSPLIVFISLFLGLGIYYHLEGVEFAFYQMPAPVAAIPAVVLALLLAKGSAEKRLEDFIEGMGNSNVLTMCLIYLLAGAFSVLTKSIGAVEAAVQLGLNIFPSSFILPGIFILASTISLAMGTSMGAISAIGPIAAGIAEKTGLPMATLFGALVGGAMFGDNLSVISDTTIAATKTQGARMVDKFKENFKIALPAALMTLLLLFWKEIPAPSIPLQEVQWFKVLPYGILLLLSLTGMNVFLVLFLGILVAAIVGFAVLPGFGIQTMGQNIFQGFKEMQEIFLLSLLMGGLGKMMKDQGGITLIKETFEKLTLRLAKNKKLHQFFTEISLALSITLTNLAVANNTVAILICGDFFKEVSSKENISPKRSASILDIFSCVTQGLIPYGAQILLASQLARVSPLEIVKDVTYCYLLALMTFINMMIRARRYERR